MHWLIPFAAPAFQGSAGPPQASLTPAGGGPGATRPWEAPDAGRQALGQLALPHLATLLAAAPPPGPADRDEADELSFSPPHERVLARAVGLSGDDGRLPWAAWQAARDGVDLDAAAAPTAWGLLTPAHWHLGTDQLTMRDPDELGLDAPASRALLDAVRDLFDSEGFTLVWGAPLRWYLGHPSLARLRTASPDRVIGRNVDPWLTPGPEGRLLRRLQNEVQMRLHGHPINAAREAAGALPVNSFWLSGCGIAQPSGWPPGLQVDDRLRRAALAGDWAAWAAAWQALDAGPLGELCHAMRAEDAALTLCGERAAVTLHPGRAPLWRRVSARLRPASPAALLETL
jgi:hypothetical protein